MYTYTLGFVKKGNQILMVNRKKKPWLGCWNGLGGKIMMNESPEACMIRELEEEASLIITPDQLKPCGTLTWNSFDANGQGLYLFLIDGSKLSLNTPVSTEEGLLDWKEIDWIIHSDNLGVAHNIKHFLPNMIHDHQRYHYHCTFQDDVLISVSKEHML
ncbi:MAG TPA: 8-oxo-dGTP diphosphatase [Acholeplasmataceae bacterium]|nr:8-oxo-dGTP diphosphatase [Acholeplasmataceae bacterium]